MLKLYNEPEDRVRPIISVVLDAVERDEYRVVLEKIYEASRSDVSAFADALSDFGLLELSMIAQQAGVRMEFLELPRIARPQFGHKRSRRAQSAGYQPLGARPGV